VIAVAAETETPSTEPPTTVSTDLPAPAPAPAPAPKREKRQPKELNIYHHREPQEDGSSIDIPNNEFWHMPRRKPAYKPRAQQGGRPKPKFKGKRKGPGQDNAYKPKPKPARKIEDSPFAALAALKNPKKD
jgi:hypothetical protein